MSLIRQIWSLLIGLLLVALLAAVGTHAWMARVGAMAQVQARNDDSAMMLALALSQQGGDAQRLQLVASSLFDTGHYRRLRLLQPDGSAWFERDAADQAGTAPAWFQRLADFDIAPGVAWVSHGWTPLGQVQVSSQSAWALDALWASCLAMTSWMAALAALAAVLGAWLVRSWQRPLDAVVAQARALEERRFVIAEEPRVPELRRLTRGMNSLVARLQRLLADQAEQLDALREQAHTDAPTGLARRRPFIGQMDAALRRAPVGGAGLLIVRVLDLAAMNRRIGHAGTDALLGALGEVLQSYPRHVEAALTGRLNGTDMALYLPAAGIAADTARSLVDALRAALATVDAGAELVIGGSDGLSGLSGGEALARADAALARAELRGAFAIEISAETGGAVAIAAGEQQWRRLLGAALNEGRTRLSEEPVLDADGRLVHLLCSMCLQWQDGDPFHPAAAWLPMAQRCRLAPQADRAALALALAAIGADRQPRCVVLTTASLASAGFVSGVQAQLAAAPEQAASLSIELRDSATSRHAARLRHASVLWRGQGVRLGLSQAGSSLRELPRLHTLGLDYLRIDASQLQDVAHDPAVRELARGLVRLLHGMGMQLLADGVDNSDDLAALWQLGFDGARVAAGAEAAT